MPWFHASPNEIPDGARLIPGGPGGEAASADFYSLGYQDRADWVWLAPDLADACFWAMVLGGQYIYEVEPDEDPEPWNGSGIDGWVVPGAVVLREVDMAAENARVKREKEAG